MNTELVQRESAAISFARNLPQMREMAAVFAAAHIVNPALKTNEEVLSVMLKAHELGISLTYALEKMSVINGNITMEAEMMLALIYDSGKLADIEIRETHDRCTVTMERRATHGSPKLRFTAEFTLQEASLAGLLSKDNWRKYPKRMLRWRAIADAARVVFPDVLGGLATQYETPLESASSVVEAEYTTAQPAEIAENAAQPHAENPAPQHTEAAQKRPYPASILQRALRSRSAKMQSDVPPAQLGILRDRVADRFEFVTPHLNAVDDFCLKMFSRKSSELSAGDCNALLSWLMLYEDDDGTAGLNNFVVREFWAFLRESGSHYPEHDENSELFPKNAAETTYNAIHD